MAITRKRRSTGKVTIADVAQLAGVGTMTVSRALRTPEQVSDKLREKIEAAVNELGICPTSLQAHWHRHLHTRSQWSCQTWLKRDARKCLPGCNMCYNQRGIK